MSAKIEVVVAGAAGRLGARVVDRLEKSSTMKPIALVRRGTARERVAPSVEVVDDPSLALTHGGLLFSAAPKDVSLALVERASSIGIPSLIATTGFSPKEMSMIDGLAATIPILVAPNLSLGVAVLVDLVERASRALREYDLEILELHHNKKKDAPSGTAWALARAAAAARDADADRDAILARSGEVGARGKEEIGIQALRGGDVVGEHTVFLIGPSERIELTHRAASRDVFADGALKALEFLAEPGRAPGRYAMRDVASTPRKS
ncbi:MAG: 4-hydroxy-tetrahydrodipicolinate reductase [Deltaproteobacteria bacterium]|nr:4-hydroxy-tetrahydrodipicolinate reductase [Deltaproteobacteria bacterium]